MSGSRVNIECAGTAWRLMRNGEPYFIKGAVASSYLDRIAQYGANSVRIGARNRDRLDTLDALGLTALVNLPVRAQRSAMNYRDAVAVKAQHEEVLSLVEDLKDHGAVLMWAVGNELDFDGVISEDNYDPVVWDEVNRLAADIHRVDPAHPVMTVVGSIKQKKITRLLQQCPELDLLGINEYGDLLKAPAWIREFGWTKPYVVTEWGPTGFWQVPQTCWNAPIEQTSSEKADIYKKRYEDAILKDHERCLGSYSFLWRQHQERTHTWFGMLDEIGRESEAVDCMRYLWTGNWPANRAPRVTAITIDNKPPSASITVQPCQRCAVQLQVEFDGAGELRYDWEIINEACNFGYGGMGETKPSSIAGLVLTPRSSNTIEFIAPQKPGPYRLFAYVYDEHGHYATANAPFLVE